MRRAWLPFGALGVLTCVVYLFLPERAQALLYDALGVAAVVGIVVGVRLHRPARPAPWYLLAAAAALWVLGDIMLLALTSPGGEEPFPSLADVPYLLGYPAVMGAVALIVRRSGIRDTAAWQDATIWTLAAAVLTWEPLLEPILRDDTSGATTRLIAVSYPAMDLLLLLLLARLSFGQGRRAGASIALTLCVGALFVTDLVYGALVTVDLYTPGGVLDLGWLLVYVGLGTLALHPGMVRLTEPCTPSRSVSSRPRLLALVVAALLAPALLAYQQLSGDHVDGLLIAAATVLLCVLTALRMLGLLSELELSAETLQAREVELHLRATTDSLTGLVNRAALLERIEAAKVAGTGFVIALLDLDGFKHVNDSLGHAAGDSLLIHVAQRLAAAASPGEVVARLGGDEFAVVSSQDAEVLATLLQEVLAGPVLIHGSELYVGASIGLARGSGNDLTADLLRNADVAMYTAKAAGGTRSAVYSPEMSVGIMQRLEIGNQLARAVEEHSFVPFFQPILDIRTGRLTGFEALARWAHPSRGLVLPDEWIPGAEDTGAIVAVDEQLLRLACRQMVAWSALTAADRQLDLAVNVSGRTLQDPGVADRILKVLAGEGLAPERLLLEVTEGVLIDDQAVGVRLQQLRAAGVRIALDDFGTGWSSLAYLRRFPVDVLKLDRSFTAGVGQGEGAEAVPAAVLQLAKALGLGVVAEGIETAEQVERLRELGCPLGQGFLFARPEPADRFEAVVRSGWLSISTSSSVPA